MENALVNDIKVALDKSMVSTNMDLSIFYLNLIVDAYIALVPQVYL